MCGRFAQFHRRDEFLAALLLETQVIAKDGWIPQYNIAPGTQVQVIHHNNEHVQLAPANWGYAPAWWHEQGKPPLINARVETVEHCRMFAPLWKYGRAVMPSSGCTNGKSRRRICS